MSQIKKTVVTLNRGVDVDAFIDEMTNAGGTTPYVPRRKVQIYNLKPESLRNIDFLMSEAEAIALRNDPRVADSRWGTKAENGIEFKSAAINTSTRNYTRANTYTLTNNSDLNWGLYDCLSNTNPFVTNTVTSNSTNYILTGNGVDVVIMDTGLQVDHPEFQNANGISRVQQINWWAASGQTGSPPWTPDPTQNNMPTGFYTDTNGHGTNVGSIAVGKTYGWATDSNIYVMNVTGDTGRIPVSLGFNLIRLWHGQKQVDPSTGFKRPTIVNCSFGSRFSNVSSVFSVNWRGNTFTVKTSTGANAPNQNSANYGILPSSTLPPITSSTDAAEVEDCLDSGVVVIASAGNNGYKIDVSSGSDYNNYATGNFVTSQTYGNISNVWFYHRGSTPGSVDGVVCVGAIDYTKSELYIGYYSNGAAAIGGVPPLTYSNANANAKSYFSSCGPRVDVYAPGGYIAGAFSTIGNSGGYPVTNYYLNPSYKQSKISGTSQSTPQVTGVLACVLEANPYYTFSDVQAWIRNNSVQKVANIGNNTYTNLYNLQGSNNRYLFMPYQTSNVGSVTGGSPSANAAGNIQGGFNL